jgi:hypothetical protein
MSHTQTQTIFAGVHESGINDLLRAFFTARPRFLNYGSANFVAATNVNATNVPAIPFGNSTIHYRIVVGMPSVDITPGGGGTPIVPGAGEFIVSTRLTLTVAIGNVTFPAVTLGIYVRCRPVVLSSSPGVGTIGIAALQVELVDINPAGLETIVEGAMLAFMQMVLGNVTLPFNTLTVGAFGLILLSGPLAETNQIKVRGNAL